jgi:hypothetical protein
MARTNDRDLFMKRLTELSGDDGNFVSNERLLKRLGWKKEKYRAIHGLLRQEELIVVKRGRGGLVAPAENQEDEKLKVFMSYSHVDKKLQEMLVKHLRPLEREGLIDVWADQQILAGGDWDKEVSAKLDRSDIILALVSIDFINSDYCYDTELEKALVREAEGQAKIIPVVLRDCLWMKSPLGRLKALPTDGKAVTSWQDIDEAFTKVAIGIRDAANALLDIR